MSEPAPEIVEILTDDVESIVEIITTDVAPEVVEIEIPGLPGPTGPPYDPHVVDLTILFENGLP